MQLLFFHRKNCPPCERMQKTVQQYTEQTQIPTYVFDAEDWYGGNDMARRYHVKHVPCLILTDDSGKEITRTEAAHSLQTLQAAFDPYIGKEEIQYGARDNQPRAGTERTESGS